MICPHCGKHIDFNDVPIGQMPTEEEEKLIRKLRCMARQLQAEVKR